MQTNRHTWEYIPEQIIFPSAFCTNLGCEKRWYLLQSEAREGIAAHKRTLPLTGQVNYVGASHQLWHVLVVLMFYWWHQMAVHIMDFRHSQPCLTRTSGR
ncbi:hypothetical protein AMECASPLE_029283 [Ameca splendens]|uniref:Uncharacterized protein n=1 Tax=Ameca splendens TaxID=208324 RepID=A0ABV0YSS1_9TELE